MGIDVASGCDAIDANPQWLRVRVASGAVRTIPWSTIRVAGLDRSSGGSEPHEFVIDMSKPADPSRQSLWILYPEGAIEVRLEESDPKRAEVLQQFPAQLGERWKGAEFSVQQALFGMSRRSSRGMPKVLIVMIAVMLLSILAAVIVLFVVKGN